MGLSEGTTDPVTLKVLRWSVAGLSEDSTDILCRRFRCSRSGIFCCCKNVSKKMDRVNVGVHQLLTPSGLVVGLRCPAVIIHQRWNGQARAVG